MKIMTDEEIGTALKEGAMPKFTASGSKIRMITAEIVNYHDPAETYSITAKIDKVEEFPYDGKMIPYDGTNPLIQIEEMWFYERTIKVGWID